MVVCQYCGKENAQPDAAYCSYCGSSLMQQQYRQALSPPPTQSTAAGGYGQQSGRSTSSAELSEAYEKALASVERLGTIVIILAIVTLILVI